MSVIVNPIQHGSRWLGTKFAKKLLKGVEAELDTSATVVFPLRVLRIVATLARIEIGNKFDRFLVLPAHAMKESTGSGFKALAVKTAATLGIARKKAGGTDLYFAAARANAKPDPIVLLGSSCIADGRKPSKHAAFEVNWFGHVLSIALHK